LNAKKTSQVKLGEFANLKIYSLRYTHLRTETQLRWVESV